MVITEYQKQNAHKSLLRDYWFWRDSKGHEVDLLYLEDGQMHINEIKASRTIKSEFLKGLDYFDKISGEPKLIKRLIYGGDTDQKRSAYGIQSWTNIT